MLLHRAVSRAVGGLRGIRPRPELARTQDLTSTDTTPRLIHPRLSSSWSKVLASKVVEIDENDLEEKFVKGGGNGGQKINKVRNSVFLKHIPTGLFVQCQKTRSLDDNRRVARKLLHTKLDDFVNGTASTRNAKIQLAQKKKAKKKAKSRQKHLSAAAKRFSSGSEGRVTPPHLDDEADDSDDFDDEGDVDTSDEDDYQTGKEPRDGSI